MKKIILLSALGLLSVQASAFQCTGTITEIKKDTAGCGAYYAYRISENNSHWVCSDSDLSDSFLLTAFSLQSTVIVYLPGSGSCAATLNQDFLLHDAFELVP